MVKDGETQTVWDGERKRDRGNGRERENTNCIVFTVGVVYLYLET